MTESQLEAVNSLDPFVEETALPLLKSDIEAMWQPSDLLPEPASPTFIDEVPLNFFESLTSLTSPQDSDQS